MSNLHSMILSIVLCIAGACSFLLWHKHRNSAKAWSMISEPFLYQDPAKCKKVLSGTDVLEDTFWCSAATLLQSRAVPNERLIRAFDIDNAFTTADEVYHREFRSNAKALLQRDESGWKHLRDIAQKLVRQRIQTAYNGNGILLVPMVQMLVLKKSIHTLFGLAIDELDNDTILLMAEKINTLWIESKTPDSVNSSVYKDQHALRGALRRTFPDMKDTTRGNPLNLILPAYETLWRVVLRCFIEVMFRSGKAGPRWHRLLLTFLSNPTQLTFEEKSLSEGGISVSMIIAETLRLYPPTRRIYRQITRGFAIEPEVVAADIEYLHRDSRFWGDDSLCFNPSRWKEISRKSRDAYMPFGSRPFICPAERQFAPWVIGILVAALVAEFENGWTWKARLQGDAIDNDKPLSLERDSYKTLEVFRNREI